MIFPLTPEKLKKQLAELNHSQNEALIRIEKLKDQQAHDLENKHRIFNTKNNSISNDSVQQKQAIEELFRDQVLTIKRKQQDEVQKIQNALRQEEMLIQNKYNAIGDIDRRAMADSCREHRETCDTNVKISDDQHSERMLTLEAMHSFLEETTKFIKKHGRLQEPVFTDEALEDLIRDDKEFDRDLALTTLMYEDVSSKVAQLQLKLKDLKTKIQNKLIFKLFQIISPIIAYSIVIIIHTPLLLFSYNYKPDFFPFLYPALSAGISLFILSLLVLLRKHLLNKLLSQASTAQAQLSPLLVFCQELAVSKNESRLIDAKNGFMKIQKNEDIKLEEKLRLIEIEQLVEMDKISKGFYEKIHEIEAIGNKALELVLKERQKLWDQHDVNAKEKSRQLEEDHTQNIINFEEQAKTLLKEQSALAKNEIITACTDLKHSIEESQKFQNLLFPNFQQAQDSWSPQIDFHNQIAFSSIDVPLYKQLKYPDDSFVKEQLPESITVPTLLELPNNASLYIDADSSKRAPALRLLSNTLLRILLTIPPGKARFTFIDPLSLGENFAAFMHLNDYQESLTGGKISTKTSAIDQVLGDLNEHLETVIQKYLRNEYSNICKYNLAAGEIAEPFHFLAIADFPFNFSEEAIKRLIIIAQNGARCGVYLIIHHNPDHPIPGGLRVDEIKNHCIFLEPKEDSFEWRKSLFKQTQLNLSPAPAPELMNDLIKKVGSASSAASSVKIPFSKIQEKSLWKSSTKNSLSVTIGLTGTRHQELSFGHGTAQHCLLAGKTGSGKSNLIHVIITNMAIKYSPDELQFFLIDFKKGVEFKSYANEALPHARAIAIESDREFGISVLRKIDEELKDRGDKFRSLNAQNISQFRDNSQKTMPRILLVIDEFQEFFTEDDNLAKDAILLLDRIVRQGRAFGIHVLLGSQTLGGTQTLPRSTMGQMGIRIALQCNESDSYLIFNENNNAARLLSRPGEAILNSHSGLPEHNSPFQTAWISEDIHHKELSRLRNKKHGHPFIFEGNVPAQLETCKAYLDAPDANTFYLGEPCAIEDSKQITFKSSPSQNALLITSSKETCLSIFMSSLSLAKKHHVESQFYFLNGMQDDEQYQAYFNLIGSSINTAYPAKAEVLIDDLYKILQSRQDQNNPSPIYVFSANLQRFRQLQKQDDFSWDESEKTPADKFDELIQLGPENHIHFFLHCDSFSSYLRILSNKRLQDFDYRILTQMSQTDSLSCIDRSDAAKLELHTALLYQDHNGSIQKLRPFELPAITFFKG
ncbi:FtsK/SpoIIIE domain-containing protein [Lentisphaera profundi]|uniref:FtsK/SpoIIIE domain-containing protein n=1 Tax=Lentisphaera profundi TaxID=1658616 RepID=A0ABY7VNY8_9BACT|nr:FtsK/SpoIIIE domain-containing protein [Lentisphaera profundi]WDE95855.1 FtsK/SpoIIIE domain-containing protein [Lentisphaera profundi]